MKSRWVGEGLFGIAAYEGFNEGGFAYTGRANDADNDGRSFFGKSVDEGNMKTFFFDLVKLVQ